MNREKTSRTPGSRAVSRGKLIAVSALFLGPLIAALVWYYGLNAGNAPLGEANHAPLITPPVPLEDFENPLHEGGSVSGAGLPRKWRIVHILGDGCGEACGKALYNTRQVRLAVGKDAGRVQRLIVAGSMQVAQEIAGNHPDAALLRPDANGIETRILPVKQRYGLGTHDAFLVDPQGNLMMAIPLDLDPRLLLKDLKNLLRLSRIG